MLRVNMQRIVLNVTMLHRSALRHMTSYLIWITVCHARSVKSLKDFNLMISSVFSEV